MKTDERRFLQRMLELHERKPYNGPMQRDRFPQRTPLTYAEDEGRKLGIHPKRVNYFLNYKWPGKGWWEYGVTARTGWFTPEFFTIEGELAEPRPLAHALPQAPPEPVGPWDS